ncbi:AraC-type DNA-binding protein [Nannocystis exedens]|uniref:AraC-type DNA-binding protein n=1 Tax=Nannocystis exedens TaxID=54 RepID=A0A1I2CYH9_9BACT|nr:AraC family transcriptional regulator [Nannocystis exedens]PCC68663.1 AraC family transcriptional regulator [Nannocystis exedens]SFE73351.1 AraC-type DNA-binding protein [Nannocystis exedens]
MTDPVKDLTESDKPAVTSQPPLAFDVPLNTAVCPPLIGAALAGVDVDALLADLGIDRRAADDADYSLAPALRAALWRESLQRSRDPALALHAAEVIPFGHFDVVDYIANESATLGEGIAAMARYFRIVRGDFRLRFEVDEVEGRLSLELPPSFGLVAPYTVEFTLACIFTRFRGTVGDAFVASEISFCYPAPGHLAEYRRVFACPLRFDADETVVRFPRAVLAQPQPRADARLRLVLERAAAVVLARLPPVSDTTQQVRQALSEELRGGTPTCDQIARRLAIGVRTLNRRLQSEGTSFQQQLAELRCELARGYLADRRLSISEVAYLLGFSEPSAFHRAFKRWTGHSPQAWRRQATH